MKRFALVFCRVTLVLQKIHVLFLIVIADQRQTDGGSYGLEMLWMNSELENKGIARTVVHNPKHEVVERFGLADLACFG